MILLRRARHCASTVALFVFFAGCAFAQSQQPRSNRTNASGSGDDQTTTDPPINITVTTPAPSPEDVRREKEYRAREVTAQEDVRDFTRMLTYLAFIQAAITLFALGASIRAANAAKHSAEAAHASVGLSRSAAAIALAQKRLGDRQLDEMREQLAVAKIGAAAARDSADASKDALTKLQRPFLSLAGWRQHARFDVRTDGTQANVSWRISPIIENSGNTPTIGMTLVINQELRDDRLPEGFVLTYRKTPKGLVIGPHSRIEGPASVITGTDLQSVQAGLKQFYIWGEARYRDIFDGTPEHHFAFCVSATDILGDPTNLKTEQNPRGTDVSFVMLQDGEHNYDRDEPAQSQEPHLPLVASL